MRAAAIVFSILLHASVLLAGVFWAKSAPTRIDLSVPVYNVELVTLEQQRPKPAPAPKPAAKPEPPKPRPAPPKPKPDPAPTKISPVKKETARPRPKPKPAPPQKTPEQIRKEALEEAKKQARQQQERDRKRLAEELAALQKSVDERPAGAGSVGQSAPAGAVQVYGRIVEGLIKENWRYPAISLDAYLSATVEISLAPDGTITDAVLVRSSGRADFDASTMRAVTETETLPPPPGRNIETIQINFNLQELVQQ